MRPYDSWGQVAGYFDGDGDIYFSDTSNQPYKLSLSLVFTDQSIEQIQMLKYFFEGRDIRTSNVLRTSAGTAYMIAISRFDCVLNVLKQMQPFLFKKSNEVRGAIEYYEGRTNGNDLFGLFGQEVEDGRRERHPRKVRIHVPYTYPEGDALMKAKRLENIRRAIAKTRAKVTKEDYEAIRQKYAVHGLSIIELVRFYPQYGRETIRRILGRGRGYVLVK